MGFYYWLGVAFKVVFVIIVLRYMFMVDNLITEIKEMRHTRQISDDKYDRLKKVCRKQRDAYQKLKEENIELHKKLGDWK